MENERLCTAYEKDLMAFESDKDAWRAENKQSKPKEPTYKPIYLKCHCSEITCTGF
jgi:hypothetical protein